MLARREIYLANHSLGRPPDRVAEDVREALDAWYADMDGAWPFWLEKRERFLAILDEYVERRYPSPLVGAAHGN